MTPATLADTALVRRVTGLIVMWFNPLRLIGWAFGVTVVGSRRLSDLEARANAANQSQAVAEYNMDGTVRTANENFLTALGFTLREIRGKHHSMFVDPAHRDSAEYRNFWSKLLRGELNTSEYRRLTRDGRDIWLQAMYIPSAVRWGSHSKWWSTQPTSPP